MYTYVCTIINIYNYKTYSRTADRGWPGRHVRRRRPGAGHANVINVPCKMCLCGAIWSLLVRYINLSI